MKKLLALLLALIMVLGMVACGEKAETPVTDTPAASDTPAADTPATEDEPAADVPASVEKVTYFCTVGAYLDTLTAAVNEWNAGEGAEKGVYIEITSNINDGSSANEILMQAGTFHDISDGTSNQAWVLNGWVKDLYEVAEMDEELAALIEKNEQYLVPGLELVNGMLVGLPLEVVPIKLAVNTDLLEEYGYEIPTTIDEMVEVAKGITEKSNGEAFGWGGTNWSLLSRRILMKAVVNSTGTLYWDPNTGTYDFTPFKKIFEAYADMYASGAILGLDDLGIDPIRAEFAEGKVAFFTAPAYDVSVYTAQFPAKCNWTVIDFPAYDESGAQYKGLYLDRMSQGIIAPAFDNATEAHQKAVIEAYKFLNSDELNARIYANGGMIPYDAELIANTEVVVDIPQWATMGDISNYTSCPVLPDSVIPLEGDNFDTVLREVIRGNLSFDEAAADLNERYNAAFQEAVEDPDINTDLYIYEWSAAK